jgi:hypothetical protein
MPRSVSSGRTLLVSAALGLSALGVLGVVAPAAAGAGSAARAVAGTTGPDAAHKRVGQVTRSTRVAVAPTTTATTATTTAATSTIGAVRPVEPTASSTSYAFSTVLDGQPVRWDPCTAIRWTANVSSGPKGGLDVLKAAVARIAAVTGTTWEYVGATDTTPTAAYLPTTAQKAYAPVLLGWADADSDLLAGQAPTVLGMTRTAWFGVQMPDGRKHAATRSAVVALDRTDDLPLTGPRSWSAVALHELGHVMGLGHVGDRSQLMADVLPATADLQAGDHAGLVRVGVNAGCVTVPGA